jgi:hypothetical protein|tara:strand:- start:934 stop:1482 length:549 start_codon:yes stop_codon:yes gene_type:complete
MRFIDWFLAFLIIVGMAILIVLSTVVYNLQDVKKNWTKYRCNPSYMWLAGYVGKDITSNFSDCIGQMQKNAMPKFTNPLHANNILLNSTISGISESVNNVRKLQGNLRPSFASNILNIQGILNNIVIVFQKFIITFRDILSRIIAIVTLLLYTMQAQFMVGESIVKGPIITALKVLSLGAVH